MIVMTAVSDSVTELHYDAVNTFIYVYVCARVLVMDAGTSMSCPGTAGMAAMVRQYLSNSSYYAAQCNTSYPLCTPGTGFAPIKAMIEQLLTEGSTQPFTLFWSARKQEELYLDEKVLAWEKHVPHFNYTPHITDQDQAPLIERITKQHQTRLGNYQVVLAGPFDFVYALRDALIKQGVPRNQLFSDAFDLEAPSGEQS